MLALLIKKKKSQDINDQTPKFKKECKKYTWVREDMRNSRSLISKVVSLQQKLKLQYIEEKEKPRMDKIKEFLTLTTLKKLGNWQQID